MTINEYNFAGKKAIVRVDFNVPIQNGVITDDTRIRSNSSLRKVVHSSSCLTWVSQRAR